MSLVKFCLPFTDSKALDFINSVPCACQSEDSHLLQAHLRALAASEKPEPCLPDLTKQQNTTQRNHKNVMLLSAALLKETH